MKHHKKVPQGRLSQGLQPQKPPPQKNAPLSAAVESDTVGYVTQSLEGGRWYQLGCPFVTLDGDAEWTVSEAFPAGFVNGDMLLLHNPETLKYNNALYWHEELSGWSTLPAGIPVTEPAQQTIRPGQGVYISKYKTSTVTFKGKVEAVKSTFGSENGHAWNQVAVVWPEETKLNDLEWTGLKDGDTLMILNTEKKAYDAQVYWHSTANDGRGAWCDLPAGLPIPSTPVDVTLFAGQAVYINKLSSSEGSVSVSSPIQ